MGYDARDDKVARLGRLAGCGRLQVYAGGREQRSTYDLRHDPPTNLAGSESTPMWDTCRSDVI